MGRVEKCKKSSSKRPRILEPSRRSRTLDSSKRSRTSETSKLPKILEASKRSSIMEPLNKPEESENTDNVVTYFDKFGMELWEMCPLDKSHYAQRKNMKQHLIECKKQFLKSPRKVECPFNPLHIINRMEIEEHILICENRVTLIKSGIDFEPKRELIDGVPAAPLNTVPTFDPYWDEEAPAEGTYDPDDRTKFYAHLRPMPPGLSKSQKKAFKAKERQRHEWLTGKTKEKPRPSPYPMKADDMQAGKAKVKTEAAIKEEANIMDAIIDGMNGAKIGDPRNTIVKQINTKLKTLQLMKIKIREEEIALQRQVEEYLASIAKTDDDSNGDPRLSAKIIANITATITPNVDPRTANLDLSSIVLPDIMTSAMLR